MAVHLQCAWIYSATQAPWAAGWLARQQADTSCRLDLVECLLGGDFGPEPPVMAVDQLARVRSRLLCVQVCLLTVGTRNLAWMRTALASGGGWPVPVIIVADALRGDAIDDLMRLGAHDFVHADASADELRVRCVIAARRRALFLSSNRSTCGASAVQAQESTWAYPLVAPAASANPADQPPRPARLPAELFLRRTFGCSADDGFGAAKARVIAGFERAYLHVALQRHRGNIARAARASDKHRRAFWGLVHKHGFDVDAYRQDAARLPQPATLKAHTLKR